MATVITVNEKKKRSCVEEGSIEKIRRFLPEWLFWEIIETSSAYGHGRIEEVRLRSRRRSCITLGADGEKKNLLLPTVLSASEITEILNRMCDGSLYAYSESMIRGFISPGGGIRVGVCGQASVDKGRILGIYNITALNIRLPCFDARTDGGILHKVREKVTRGEGVLIYSPPGQGKTTLLRSLAKSLSGGTCPLRTALVDTREEMGMLSGESLSLDILSGYPQSEGIRIATAYMNPQVILCDEIGSEEDALAIASAQNCGVPLIATAHGSDILGIMKRRGIFTLHNLGAFGAYLGVRIDGSGGFAYDWQDEKEVRLEAVGTSDDPS